MTSHLSPDDHTGQRPTAKRLLGSLALVGVLVLSSACSGDGTADGDPGGTTAALPSAPSTSSSGSSGSSDSSPSSEASDPAQGTAEGTAFSWSEDGDTSQCLSGGDRPFDLGFYEITTELTEPATDVRVSLADATGVTSPDSRWMPATEFSFPVSGTVRWAARERVLTRQDVRYPFDYAAGTDLSTGQRDLEAGEEGTFLVQVQRIPGGAVVDGLTGAFTGYEVSYTDEAGERVQQVFRSPTSFAVRSRSCP
ncbi:hypothetical protein [Nocardioides bruguierae]|uniref:Uncharacterized protein n=1 Tax=Nocardioides bruguierae TaxID=2945102 RepID=A0A9X2D780_9ACTN|nr:hypothetical protein [Nocardioides bruguierae]MCM0620668.1 hypothetical protein [Nocardioides bruguierae]